MHLDSIFELELKPSITSGWFDDLTKEEIIVILNDFFDRMKKKPKAWYVFHQIGGLDCKSKQFEIGQDILLFDSRKWDYGEGSSLDLPGLKNASRDEFISNFEIYDIYRSQDNEIKYKRASARVRALVFAQDMEMAIRIARINVHKAIATLVFANSELNFGFKPVIPQQVHVANERMLPYRSFAESIDSSTILEIDEQQASVTQSYDALLKKCDGDTKTLFERALSWYYKGRWEETPHAKFVSYWVGLEHLIAKYKAKKSTLIENVPRLLWNWRVYHGSTLSRLLLLIDSIKSDPALLNKIKEYSELKTFDQEYELIFENIDLVKKLLIKTQYHSTFMEIANIANLENLKKMKSFIMNERDKEKFEIALLNQKRNSLVHEGLSFSNELVYYNRKLEIMFRRVIYSFLVHYNHNSNKTLGKIVEQIERPFPV